jgi:hypothetical protein
MATDSPGTPATPTTPRRPATNVYTWMLILSLLLIMIACIMLLLEWSQYWAPGNWFQMKPTA